jgi:ubiquinone/menaquinone biosynthesis C-methylase UbiE
VKPAQEPTSDYPAPGIELPLIERLVSLEGRRVLELGCGDGRLTVQIARVAASVVAVEPDASIIALARRGAASEGITNISFRLGSAERLRAGGGLHEVAIFSWSL